jgi:ligand-binding SRPBCC domain-containing protein
MIRIEVITTIAAPIERCFDLSRSIDVHMASTNWTREQAIAGITSGLIGYGETVTWRGRHFGILVKHTSQITAFEYPVHFQDAMVRGMFRTFCHDHYFEAHSLHTRMRDVMIFEAPLGPLGKLVEKIVLDGHMRKLLQKRNQHIRKVAESSEWSTYLSAVPPKQ